MKMHRPVIIMLTAALCVLATVSPSAQVQVGAADYERALGLRARYLDAAAGIADPATFIPDTSEFWYRRSVKGGHEFLIVNAETLQKRPAFDHQQLAAGLSKATGGTYSAVTLPFPGFRFVDARRAVEVTAEGAQWRCTLADYVCRKFEIDRRERRVANAGRPENEKPRTSPDGKWEAFVDNYNIVVREPGSKTLVRLTTDGSEGDYYDIVSIAWSPDSRRLAAYRVRPGYRREVHYVESSPADQLQPKHTSRFYAKPGDVLDVDRPVILDVQSRSKVVVDDALFPNAYDLSDLAWRRDSRALTFEYNQRGHQFYRVIEADVDGKTRAVISEETSTFFNYRTANGSRSDSGKKYRHDVDDRKEVVWMSERDGWNRLYLYDGVTGAVKNQITKGPWVVRGVVKVDDARRQIWFSGGGMNPDEDPYFVHYYRVNFDGSGLTELTEAKADHSATFSSDMKYYVDTFSRVDLAPVMELRRAADRSLVARIERGDSSALQAAGWRPP